MLLRIIAPQLFILCVIVSSVSAKQLAPPDHTVRLETIVAASELFKSSNPVVRKNACLLMLADGPRLDEKSLTLRQLLRTALNSEFLDVVSCSAQTLSQLARKKPITSKATLKRLVEIPSENISATGYAIRALVLSGVPFDELVVPPSTSKNPMMRKWIIVDTSKNMSDVVRHFDTKQFSILEISSAIIDIAKRLPVQNATTFKKQRREWLTLIESTNRGVKRATLVGAYIALGATPKEIDALFDKVVGIYEFQHIYFAMRKWGPEQSWVLPRLIKNLRIKDPFVYETIAALKSIGVGRHKAEITYELSKHLNHKLFGEAVAGYLATIGDVEHLAVWSFANAPKNAFKFLKHLAENASCPTPVRRSLSKGSPQKDHLNRLAVLQFKKACGENIDDDVIAWLQQDRLNSQTIGAALRLVRSSKRTELEPYFRKVLFELENDTSPRWVVGWYLQSWPALERTIFAQQFDALFHQSDAYRDIAIDMLQNRTITTAHESAAISIIDKSTWSDRSAKTLVKQLDQYSAGHAAEVLSRHPSVIDNTLRHRVVALTRSDDVATQLQSTVALARIDGKSKATKVAIERLLNSSPIEAADFCLNRSCSFYSTLCPQFRAQLSKMLRSENPAHKRIAMSGIVSCGRERNLITRLSRHPPTNHDNIIQAYGIVLSFGSAKQIGKFIKRISL